MRLRALAWALLLLPVAAAAGPAFVDDGGRSVDLPPAVARVVPAGPPAQADLAILAPGKLAGLVKALDPDAAALLPPGLGALPVIGRLTQHGGPGDLGPLRRAAPDLVVDIGSIDRRYAALADQVQAASGIPYILVAGGMADSAATFRKLGGVLGVPDRAEALARYADETLALVRARVAQVPPAMRPAIYLAREKDGLQTGPAGSINAEVLALLGARNVAEGDGRMLLPVTLDQIAQWRPDVILANDPAFHGAALADPAWQHLDAVKAGRFYLAPALPFGWIDEPPAANRLIGLRWLGKLLYPTLFPEDIRAEIRAFYALFYGVRLRDEQLDRLLAP